MAQSENKLDVEVRTQFGKGAARRIRATDRIPAVLYGHGTEPQHLTLPGHDTMLIIRKANAVIELNIAGESDSQLALVKDVQRDPVRRIIEHLDLLIVRKGERVEIEVPVHLVGEPAAGTVAFQDATTLHVSAEATHIPEAIEVSVEGLEEGAVIHATDVKLPSGTKLVDDETEIIVATVSVPHVDTESDAGEPAEAEAGDADEAAAEEPAAE